METRPFQVCLLCSFCSSDRGFAHRELFIPQSGFLQTPPHDGRPCLRLTVPTAKPVVDFHHQVIIRAGHTKENASAIAKYESVVKNLMVLYPNKKLPNIESLERERTALITQRTELNETYKEIVAELKEIEFSRNSLNEYLKNIDKIHQKNNGELE